MNGRPEAGQGQGSEDQGLSKERIISRRAEIGRLMREGRFWRDPVLRVRYDMRSDSASRMAVVVSRRFGSAVRRNKAKRICREIFRKQAAARSAGMDIVMIPSAVPAFEPYERSYDRFLEHARVENSINNPEDRQRK